MIHTEHSAAVRMLRFLYPSGNFLIGNRKKRFFSEPVLTFRCFKL